MMNSKSKSKKTYLVCVCLLVLLSIPMVSSACDAAGSGFSDESRKVYQPATDTGFYPVNRVYSIPFEDRPFTRVDVVSDEPMRTTTYCGVPAYGVVGSNVSIILSFNYSKDWFQNGWYLSDDSADTVSGVYTGHIGSGAIVIQKKVDGCWKTLMSNPNAYDSVGGGRITYTPSLEDLQSTTIFRILYAYEIYHGAWCDFLWGLGREYRNYLEETIVAIGVDDANGVTFKNMTSAVSYGDNEEGKVLQSLESLQSGSVTATGFKVCKLNKHLAVKVVRNGCLLANDAAHNTSYTAEGKYDITVSSALGHTRNYTFYVDSNANNRFDRLFGYEGPLCGNMVFDPTSQVPVYVGGTTQFSVNPASSYAPPYICNVTCDGNTVDSFSGRNGKVVPINEAGSYSITVNEGLTTSGDIISYSFAFNVIDESDVTGPQVNKALLENMMYPTDFDTSYWGYAQVLGESGELVLMYATEDRAKSACLAHEFQLVEEMPEGFVWGGTTYVDSMDITEAINGWVESHVFRGFIDVRESATYLSYSPESFENLGDGIVGTIHMFGSEDDRQMLHSDVPILSSKPYRFGEGDYVLDGSDDLIFVKDERGLDSDRIELIDCNGARYVIQYGVPLMGQLAAMHVPSGPVVFEEWTYCSYKTSYEAYYLPDGINTAEMHVEFSFDGNSERLTVTKDYGKNVLAQRLTLESLVDPMGDSFIVLVTNGDVNNALYYTAEDLLNEPVVLKDKGIYTITAVNRVGATISFEVQIVSLREAFVFIGGEIIRTVVGDMFELPEADPGQYWALEDGTPVGDELHITGDTRIVSMPLAEVSESSSDTSETIPINVPAGAVMVLLMCIGGVFVARRVW